ncbi:MAG TPA: hypothetical protein VF158_04620 [Longimicrobiales bacterium]
MQRIWFCRSVEGYGRVCRAPDTAAAKVEAAQYLGPVVDAVDITDALASHLAELVQLLREGRRMPDGRWVFLYQDPAEAIRVWLGAPAPPRCPECGCAIQYTETST